MTKNSKTRVVSFLLVTAVIWTGALPGADADEDGPILADAVGPIVWTWNIAGVGIVPDAGVLGVFCGGGSGCHTAVFWGGYGRLSCNLASGSGTLILTNGEASVPGTCSGGATFSPTNIPTAEISAGFGANDESIGGGSGTGIGI